MFDCRLGEERQKKLTCLTTPGPYAYRIYSNKRRGAHLIFRPTSAALIRGRHLFEGGAYLKIVPDKFTFSVYLFNDTLSIC